MSIKTKDAVSTDFESKGIICTKCGGPVEFYDPGSARYQEYYGHPLPQICDRCLTDIFNFPNKNRHI